MLGTRMLQLEQVLDRLLQAAPSSISAEHSSSSPWELAQSMLSNSKSGGANEFCLPAHVVDACSKMLQNCSQDDVTPTGTLLVLLGWAAEMDEASCGMSPKGSTGGKDQSWAIPPATQELNYTAIFISLNENEPNFQRKLVMMMGTLQPQRVLALASEAKVIFDQQEGGMPSAGRHFKNLLDHERQLFRGTLPSTHTRVPKVARPQHSWSQKAMQIARTCTCTCTCYA